MVRDGSLRDPVSKGLHPRMQLAAHHSPRVRWLKTLLEILHHVECSPTARTFVVVYPSPRSPEVAIVLAVTGPPRVCPSTVPHLGGSIAPFLAVDYVVSEVTDEPERGQKIAQHFGLKEKRVEMIVAQDRSEVDYGARVLGEAAARRIPGVRSDVATPSYLVPPARDEAPGDIFVGLRVELYRMPNKAYDGLRGVVVAPTTQGHWAVMPLPEDQLRALSLRAFARAKAQGVRPTRVRNKDPLKPLPVPGKFLRPIIDPERAPPRPADGIGI